MRVRILTGPTGLPGSDDGGSQADPPRPPIGRAPPGGVDSPQASTISEQGTALPILYGTAKAAVLLAEKLTTTVSQPVAWVAGLTYVKGDIRAGPDGHGVYKCTVGGLSGTVGPTGTGTGIADNLATWDYVQQLPFPQYVQNFAGVLCEGEIAGAWKVWWDKETFGNLTVGTTFGGKPGLTIYRGVDAGTQALPAAFDSSGYQHTAMLVTDTGGAPSGTQLEQPESAVAVSGLLFGASTLDPSPADIVNDLLTHTRRGRGWPSGRVDASITGTAAGGFRVYCDAMGFRFSMLIDAERPAMDIIKDILNATNSDCVWSGGKLKIVPLGDQPIASPVYGATGYVPTNTAQFNLGPDQLLEPVELVERREDAACFNLFPLEFTDRGSGAGGVLHTYARATLGHIDQIDADTRGELRQAPPASLPCIYPDGTPIVALSKILAQRSLKVRNTYRFMLPFNFLGLEPTDIVTLTDAQLGLVLTPVRILTMSERNGVLEFYAEDYPAGVAASVGYPPAIGDGYQPNEKLAATNIAAIVEAARSMGVKTSNQLYGSDFSSGLPPDAAGTVKGGWLYSRSNAAFDLPLLNFSFNSYQFVLGANTDAQNDKSKNTFWVQQVGRLVTGDTADMRSTAIPVTPGLRYCAAFYSGALQCKVRVLIVWLNSAMALVSTTTADAQSDNDNEKNGGNLLSDFKRIFTISAAPATAVYAQVYLRKFDTSATFTSSYMFGCRASFEEMPSVVDPLDSVVRGPLTPSPWAQAGSSIVEFDSIKVGALRTSNYAETGETPWAASTSYPLLQTLVSNGGNLYVLLQTGTSAASGGPTGTAARGIVDNGCRWGYVGPAGIRATAGAKLDHTGVSIKAAAANLQVGRVLMAGLIKRYTISIAAGGTVGTVLFTASEPDDQFGVSITMASGWGALVAGNAEFGSIQRFPDQVTFSIRTAIPIGQTAFYEVTISRLP